MDGRWAKFETVAQCEATPEYKAANVCRPSSEWWRGPGWYHVATGSQRCPRGCCYDTVARFRSAAKVVADLAEEMRELAGDLRDARSKVAPTGGREGAEVAEVGG